jgi:hypothetical protein
MNPPIGYFFNVGASGGDNNVQEGAAGAAVSGTTVSTAVAEDADAVGESRSRSNGGFIKGILRGVRCTKSLRVLFLHRRPPSWTTLVLYSRAVFIFNEPALNMFLGKLFRCKYATCND